MGKSLLPDFEANDFDFINDMADKETNGEKDAWNVRQPTKKKNIRVNFMVNTETKHMLDEMAEFHGLTISAYLNELIRRDYAENHKN